MTMEKTTLAVGGMTCMGCVAGVKRVLDGIPGVASAEVTLEPGQATVTYDPATAGLQAIKAAISDAGYDVA
jgi:copper chaperone CopZ